MAYQGFSGSGTVGNFASTTILETMYPAARYAGRRATVETSGIVYPYFSTGAAWVAEATLNSAGTALVSGDGNTVYTKAAIRAAIQSASISRLPPAISSGPAITVVAVGHASVSTLTTEILYDDARITKLGASFVLDAGQSRVRAVTSDPSGSGASYSNPTASAYTGSSSGAYLFGLDEPLFAIRAVAEFAKLYVKKGNDWEDAGTTAMVDGSTRMLVVDWSGVRAHREYRLELTGSNAAYFRSINVTAGYALYRTPGSGLKAIVCADSYGEPTFGDSVATSNRFNGAYQVLGRLLGIEDWRICASGGTGWEAVNTPLGRANLQTRLEADVLSKGPFDLVILPVSGNDTPNTATLAAATSNILTRIRASMPTAEIIVPLTWRKDDASESAYNAVDAAVVAGIAASGVRCTTYSQVGWITAGNKGVYIGADATHLSVLGHYPFAASRHFEECRSILLNWR